MDSTTSAQEVQILADHREDMTTDTTAAAPPAVGPTPRASSRLPWRELGRFAVVGVGSTVAYGALYFVLRPVIGAFAANATALLITAVANTAVNRRLTFGVRGRDGAVGDHAVGLLAFGAGLALTTGALAVLHAGRDPGRGVELVVLTMANALATLLRFAVLKLTFSRRTRLLGS
jgi:putative flippase GtrA